MSDHCVLCALSPDLVLWQNAVCRVIMPDESAYPGVCRVILRHHVAEMSDLSLDARQQLMAVVFAVEAAVRRILQPDKINLASLGNYVPHLHWHVIPRWRQDAYFPDSIWSSPQRAAPGAWVTAAQLAALRQALQGLDA